MKSPANIRYGKVLIVRLGYLTLITLMIAVMLVSCRKESHIEPVEEHKPTYFDIEIPFGFPSMKIPDDNPMTKEGFRLGSMLYYDPVLHPDSSMSCATCHNIQYGFTTPGTDVLAHINLGWSTNFLWDGRVQAKSLEEINIFEVEAFFVTDLEMLRRHPVYPGLFKEAFGSEKVTVDRIAKALSQYMRMQISAGSPFDQYASGRGDLTDQELRGLEIFMSEPRNVSGTGRAGADCFHCHAPPLFTSNNFHNIGLDSVFLDPESQGRFRVTGDSSHIGAWKAPTLRNAALRDGYMHDVRFSTLEEVVEFYNSGGHKTPWTDPFMKTAGRGGLQLTENEKQDLIAFLKALTDEKFLEKEEISSPFD